jgi:hypothetical protein
MADREWGEVRMSLYQVSTRASRRRRIGAWLRAWWSGRTASGRHNQGAGRATRYVYAPKVVQHAFAPPATSLPREVADLPAAEIEALVRSQGTVKLSVPTVKQRPGSDRTAREGEPIAADDAPAPEPPDQPTDGLPRVPHQRPPSRSPSVYPNAYRAR